MLGAQLLRADAQNQWRTRTGTHHALGFVFMKNGNGISAMQLLHRQLHGLEQVAFGLRFINAVDQVDDDFGVGLAVEHIALGLELGAQFVVVFDDAVVHQGHAGRV